MFMSAARLRFAIWQMQFFNFEGIEMRCIVVVALLAVVLANPVGAYRDQLIEYRNFLREAEEWNRLQMNEAQGFVSVVSLDFVQE